MIDPPPPKKPAATEITPHSADDHTPQETTTPVPVTPETSQPTPSKTGLKRFINALSQIGCDQSMFMSTAPATVFYRCRGLFLFHKYGDFTENKGWKHKASLVTADTWERLNGTVRQDAYAELLNFFLEVQTTYKLFTDD